MLAIIMSIENELTRNKVEEIYIRYNGTMLHVAKSILHDEGLAEDAVSEAFIRIIDNLEKIGAVDSNKTRGYVVIIVRNISLNMIKQRDRNVTIPIKEYSNTPDFEDPTLESLTSEEACQEISDSIERLHKNYSDILFLKIVHELTDSEISDTLGITHDNVRNRLSRARNALKKELTKEGVGV